MSTLPRRRQLLSTADAASRERVAQQVSAATYGSVLVLAALATIGVSEVALGHGVELVAGVGVGTWLAHLFAQLLGGHVRHDEPLGRGQVKRAAADGSPILASTVLPAIVLMLGRVDLLADSTARIVAVLVAVLQMLAIGVVVARATATPAGSWIFAAATVVVGCVVVALVVLLGH